MPILDYQSKIRLMFLSRAITMDIPSFPELTNLFLAIDQPFTISRQRNQLHRAEKFHSVRVGWAESHIRGDVGSLVALLLMINCFLQQTLAVPLIFDIDASQTRLAISGSLAEEPFSAQGPGALTTSYHGTINADLTTSTLQFTGGSTIDTETNGIWQPATGGGAGSEPADYGVTNSINLSIGAPMYFPGNAAFRNIALDLTSPVLNLTNGGFAGDRLVFSFVTNTSTFDYDYNNYEGSIGLDGDSTNLIVGGAVVLTNAGIRTITIQINSQFPFALLAENDSIIDLAGQLVATNAVPLPPPIIQSIIKVGQDVVVTTENTTAQSLLILSTNLAAWSSSSATVTTNGLGLRVFSSPIRFPKAFYRVQQ